MRRAPAAAPHKETAGAARSAHANKKSNAPVADSKRTMDGLAASDPFDGKDAATADKPAESKDDTHGQLSSTVVSSTQEDGGGAPTAEGEAADASDEEGGKRKKRKEEPIKEAVAKPAQPPRGTAGRMLPGTKPPGPASKTGAVPLGKNSQGASATKPGATGVTIAKSAPGPAAKTTALTQGKSAGVMKGTGSVSTPSKGIERKSPEDTLKPNPAKDAMEVDGEETKAQESSGPKVPPLKIVIPGGVGGGGGGSGAQQEGDCGAGRGGGGKGRGSAGTLPYVMPCTSEGPSNNGADSNDDDKKNSGDEKRVLRSHRTTDEKDKEDRTTPPAAGSVPPPSVVAPAAATAVAATEAPAPPRPPVTVPQEDATTTSTTVTTTTTTTTSSSTSWSSSASSNELHPRKRKIRASKESHQRDAKEQPAEAAAGGAAAETQPAHHSNPYQQYIDIRRQIERRQKGLFPVQPKPPQGFKDYLMNRGTYLLQRNIKPMPPVNAPANLPPQMRDQYVKHEKERHNLKIQHIIEKEKLVLSVEQEILRVHGRAARALANQALPFSACTILRDKEVYNAITPEQEEKERNAQRSRYNGRLFLSWLQDVDDKWEKIKEGMVRRHHTEAETLHAVQKMQWEWRLKEFGLCDYKSTPKIEPSHVPQVHVSDDFDLLPA